jgi:serine/threonine protein kinase
MIAHDIALGMEKIQSFEMIHRDLKPANILLNKATPENNGGNANRQYIVKIADFGYARRDTNDSVRKSVVGTPAYLAPELIGQTKSFEVSKATDVYSYGVVRIHVPVTTDWRSGKQSLREYVSGNAVDLGDANGQETARWNGGQLTLSDGL